MPIINQNYFNAKYKLANTAPSDIEGADLAIFITDYEREYLTDMLGYKLAKDLYAAVALPAATGPLFDLWKGAEFTDKHGRLNKWPGFSNTEDLSPIAMFVYCKWQNDRQSYSSGSGERIVKTENSEPVTVRGKFVKAWNDMVNMNFILDDFLTQNATNYPDYPGIYGKLGSHGNIKYFKTVNLFHV